MTWRRRGKKLQRKERVRNDCEKVKRSEPHTLLDSDEDQDPHTIESQRSKERRKERRRKEGGKRKRLPGAGLRNKCPNRDERRRLPIFILYLYLFQSMLLVFLLRVVFLSPSCFFDVSCSHWTLKWFFLFTVPSPILPILANVFRDTQIHYECGWSDFFPYFILSLSLLL